MKSQTVNNVLLHFKGMSVFLKVWSLGHLGPRVPVKTDSRTGSQPPAAQLRGAASGYLCQQAPPVTMHTVPENCWGGGEGWGGRRFVSLV